MIAGIGVDVVDIARVTALLESKRERALERLLTDNERRYCLAKAVPDRHVAVRIAAKEAAFKALSGSDSARGIGWREMVVGVDALGRPSLILHGRAAARANELGITRSFLTLTHGASVAIAVVVLETGE